MPASALMVTNLALSFGDIVLVHPLTFTMAAGERVALLGASGSGKSLTAAALAGAVPEGITLTGEVAFPTAEGACEGTSGASLVRQDPASALNPLVPVGTQLVLPLRRSGLNRSAARAEAERLLARAGVEQPARIFQCYTGELSGGQLQRVCVALALACGKRVLIADEPTTALDPVNRLKVLEALREWGTEGRSLLFITHDLQAAAALCTRALVMEAGRIVEDSPMRRLLEKPQHPYARRLVRAAQAGQRLAGAAA